MTSHVTLTDPNLSLYKPQKGQLLDNLKLASPVSGENVLPLLPDALQLRDIRGVDFVHVRLLGLRVLHDFDGFPHDDVEWAPIGHYSNVVIENAAGVEERHSEAEHFFDGHLDFVN